jgi:hypothetical protein
MYSMFVCCYTGGERSQLEVKDRNSKRGPRNTSETLIDRSHDTRPEHFSTYVPRELVRRLKVVAAIHDVPLWAIVTDGLERYLQGYEREHGRLPKLSGSGADRAERG